MAKEGSEKGKRPRTWWRVVKGRTFEGREAGTGPQFAWCGHEFWEGTVDELHYKKPPEKNDEEAASKAEIVANPTPDEKRTRKPRLEAITLDLLLMAKDEHGERSSGFTARERVSVPSEAFPEDGARIRVGDRVVLRQEWLPDSVRMVAARMKPGTRQKRFRENETDQRRFEAAVVRDWPSEDDPEEVPAPAIRRAYPEDPERAQEKARSEAGSRLLQRAVAELINPPTHGYRGIPWPDVYLSGMRILDPAGLELEGFSLVGASDYCPRPGPLLDVRRFVLAEGAYPSDDLRRCGISQQEASVVQIPYLDDPNAIYREVIIASVFTGPRVEGVEEGTLTRVWAPRPEGGSLCYAKADWRAGGTEPVGG